MLLVNQILHNRYRIIRQLGHGGMGAVYEAHDNVFDTTVALKEIRLDTGKSNPKQHEMMLRAFEREAKILAKIKHEVVPHVRDYFTDTNRQFLVMELVEGKDLGEMVEERQTPFALEDVLRWTEQLLDGLDYLHTQNPPIYHRDLKPQNLKLTPRGRIKLLDFGIAKGGAETPNSTTINNQTFVAATLNYSPIEQIFRVLDPVFREVLTQRFEAKIQAVMEQNADARSDIYALGATAYHLLTGVLPIDALKRTMEVWSGKNDPLQHPLLLNNRVPPEIGKLLLKAMEIDHDQRFASALEMQQALTQALAGIKEREKMQAEATVQIPEDKLRQMKAAGLQATRLPEIAPHDATQPIPVGHAPVSEPTMQSGATPPTPFGTPFNQPATGGPQTGGQQPPPTGVNPFQTGGATPYHTGGQQPPTQQVNFAAVPTGQGAPPYHNQYQTGGQQFPPAPISFGQGYPQHSQQTLTPQKSSRKILWALPILGLLFLAIGGLGFGLLFWQQSQTQVTTDPTPSVAPSPAATVAAQQQSTPASSGETGAVLTPSPTATPAAASTPARTTVQNPVQNPQTRPTIIPPSRQQTTTGPSAGPKKKKVTVDDIINDSE